MGSIEECRELTDDDLSRDLRFLAKRDHHCLGKLLSHLAEFDRRQLSMKESGISLFTHCVRVLGYDEFDAYRRIRAARVVDKYPVALELIEAGRLSLTAIVLVAPHLDPMNHRAWFKSVCGKSRRQIEALIAARHPQAARPDQLYRFAPGAVQFAPTVPPAAVDVLASGTPQPENPAYPPANPLMADGDATASPSQGQAYARPHEWQAIVPISLERVRIGFDASISVMALIDRAKQVLRHKYPDGRLEDVMKEALELLLEKKDPQRRLTLKRTPVVRDAVSPPENTSLEPRFFRDMKAGRYIPAWVKRAVWERDAGRCAWRFEDGTLCGSKDWIEFDHVKPFAKGGRSDTPRNIRLLCRVHNQQAGKLEFPTYVASQTEAPPSDAS